MLNGLAQQLTKPNPEHPGWEQIRIAGAGERNSLNNRRDFMNKIFGDLGIPKFGDAMGFLKNQVGDYQRWYKPPSADQMEDDVFSKYGGSDKYSTKIGRTLKDFMMEDINKTTAFLEGKYGKGNIGRAAMGKGGAYAGSGAGANSPAINAHQMYKNAELSAQYAKAGADAGNTASQLAMKNYYDTHRERAKWEAENRNNLLGIYGNILGGIYGNMWGFLNPQQHQIHTWGSGGSQGAFNELTAFNGAALGAGKPPQPG
jgi:hypothetical protein